MKLSIKRRRSIILGSTLLFASSFLNPVELKAQTPVTGNVESVPSMTHKKAKVVFRNQSTGNEYIAVTDTLTGEFTRSLPNGTYTQLVEADSNFRYRKPNILITGATDIDMRSAEFLPITSPFYTNIMQVLQNITTGGIGTWADSNRPINVYPRRPNESDPFAMQVFDTTDYNEAVNQIVTLSGGKVQFNETADSNTIGINFKHVPQGTPPLGNNSGFTVVNEYYPDLTPKRVTCYINRDVNVLHHTFLRELMRALRTFNTGNDPQYIMGGTSFAQNLHQDEGQMLKLMFTLNNRLSLAPYTDTLVTSVAWPTAPGTPAWKYPADGAVNLPTSLTASWYKTAGQNAGLTKYHFILKDSSFTNTITESIALADTFAAVSGLQVNKLYHFIIAAHNDFDTSAYDTISARTLLPLPGIPTLQSPTNNQQNVPLSVILQWLKGTDAISTIIEYGLDSTFQNTTRDSTEGASLNITAPAHSRVFWRGKSKNPTGYSAFTPRWAFNTLNNVPTITQALRDSAFNQGMSYVLFDPSLSNNAVDPDGDVLSKSILQSPAGLGLIIRNDSLMAYPNPDYFGASSPILTFADAYGGLAADTFQVIINHVNRAPAAAVLLEPAEGDTVQGDTMTFSWSTSEDPDNDLIEYQWRLWGPGIDTTFQTIDTTCVLTGTLSGHEDYYWTVNTSDGLLSVPTDTIRFHTGEISSIDHRARKPAVYAFGHNFPNPFNPSTQIRFTLPEKSRVRLVLYNALGQAVKVVLDETRTAGMYTLRLDLSGNATGIYFLRMEARGSQEQFILTRKMLYVK